MQPHVTCTMLITQKTVAIFLKTLFYCCSVSQEQ